MKIVLKLILNLDRHGSIMKEYTPCDRKFECWNMDTASSGRKTCKLILNLAISGSTVEEHAAHNPGF